jgi:putative transposase
VRLRVEYSNEHVFASLAEAQRIIEAWRIDYNIGRPHSALSNQTPAAFAAASVLATQRGEALRYPRGFAPRPVAPQALMGSNLERTQASTGRETGSSAPTTTEIALLVDHENPPNCQSP